MYFMNGSRTMLVNADHVERFCISEKEDSCLIVASYDMSAQPVTLARYHSMDEATQALFELHIAISEDEPNYYMPANTGTYVPPKKPSNGYHGAKDKRHGGS